MLDLPGGTNSPAYVRTLFQVSTIKQGKSEGFDSCDQPSNFA